MCDTIRVGLLGWGNAGRFFHAPLITSDDGFELVAAVTSRREIVDAYPGIDVYDTVEALVSCSDIDLVVIATPHRHHAAHASLALEAGKHVVVEKPFATSVEETQAMIALADRVDRRIMAFQNRRWDGDFLTVRKIVASGILGRIHFYEAHWPFYRPELRGVWRENPDEFGGLFLDLAPHLIDQAVCLFGKPESVYAQIETHRDGGRVDDFFRVNLRFESGVTAVIGTDALAENPPPRFSLRGDRGSFVKEGLDPQEAALRAGRRPVTPGWGIEDPSFRGHLRTTGYDSLHFDGTVDTVAGDYPGFYRAVHAAITGGESFPVTPADIVVQLRILEASRLSASSNTVISVDWEEV